MLGVMYDRVPEQFHNNVSGYIIIYRRVDVNGTYRNVTVRNSSILEVNIMELVGYVNYSVEVAAIDTIILEISVMPYIVYQDKIVSS